MNLKHAQVAFIPKIEAEMRRIMTPPPNAPAPFYGMLHYHLGWLDEQFQPVKASAGKRLRPLFTVLSCIVAGGDPERALTAAAAIELIHNFSLIHDDIEDNSRTRRGRATVWALWGAPQAINAGDAMFAIARNALLDMRSNGVPPSTVLEALDCLDQTSLTLCKGQYLDMSFEQRPSVELDEYLTMIEAKTAALLACAGFLGGLIATDDPQQAEVFGQLGRGLGMAFQVQDDLLGIWGDEVVTGKPAADDLRHRKKSFPVVFALNGNNHDQPQRTRFKALYQSQTSTEADIAEMIALLEEIGAKTYTEVRVSEYIEQAQTALQAIPALPVEKQALQELTDYLIGRSH